MQSYTNFLFCVVPILQPTHVHVRTLVKYLDFLSYILSARIVNKACQQDYIRRYMHILHTRIYFLEVYSERYPVGFLRQHTKCRSPIMHLPTALPSISIVNTACFKGMTIAILTGETQSARTHALILCTSGLSAQGICSSILFLFFWEPVFRATSRNHH